jgi:hypothetical protein
MAHHYVDPAPVPHYLKKACATAPEEIGPTGQYSMVKLGECGGGEIAFAVAADKTANRVLINFGKPVAFLGMTGEQAIKLGRLLIAKALGLTN